MVYLAFCVAESEKLDAFIESTRAPGRCVGLKLGTLNFLTVFARTRHNARWSSGLRKREACFIRSVE